MRLIPPSPRRRLGTLSATKHTTATALITLLIAVTMFGVSNTVVAYSDVADDGVSVDPNNEETQTSSTYLLMVCLARCITRCIDIEVSTLSSFNGGYKFSIFLIIVQALDK